MIDVESMVFNTIYNQLSVLYPDANITAGFDERSATFPAVIVTQTESIPYQAMNTDECAENFARITYEIEVYSNKYDTGRGECKTILQSVDGIMQGMKFRRIHTNKPVYLYRSYWKQYARYEVIVGKPVTYDIGTANERTVYQMYRR